MASSDKRRSDRKLPMTATAEIPGIVSPLADPNPIPAALAAPVKIAVPPSKPIVARKVGARPAPAKLAEAIVAPVAAIAPAPVVEQAIEHTVAAVEDVTATFEAQAATIAEQVVDTAETTAGVVGTAAAPLHDLTTATHTQQEKTIMDTMQTATDKTQAMFADANDRTKGAMEKGAKFFQEITEFGKGNMEAVVESSKIAAKGFETMGQETAAYLKTSFEDATQAFRTLATIKSPADLMKFQSDYLRTAFDAMVAQSSRGTEASLKLAGEVAQPISNRVAIAAEKIKIAA